MRYVLTVILVMALPVHAADYPYTGVFSVGPATNSGDTQTPEEARNNCASAFFLQKADGRFAYYVIDRAGFEKTGEPSYALTQEAVCTFETSTQTDFCADKRSIYAPARQASFATLYQVISPDKLVFRSFGNPADLQTFTKDKTSSLGFPFEAYRCPFTEAQISRYLTTELTKMSVDDASAALVLAVNVENTAFLKRVLKIVLGN